MKHFYYDGMQGFRSRFDDLKLVQEFLDELPGVLGLSAAMPAFLLPYYNGVEPDDCGISAFMFLAGGHATLHTFSFREALFFDLVYPTPFPSETCEQVLKTAFPCRVSQAGSIDRSEDGFRPQMIRPENDFGPHVFLDLEGYRGPLTMDDLFRLFDRLPGAVGMTPIMRPYVVENVTSNGERVLSAMTMIAESHVSIHVFPESRRAFFDLFSCRFFDTAKVLEALQNKLPADVARHTVAGRGPGYRQLRAHRKEESIRGRGWLKSIIPEND